MWIVFVIWNLIKRWQNICHYHLLMILEHTPIAFSPNKVPGGKVVFLTFWDKKHYLRSLDLRDCVDINGFMVLMRINGFWWQLVKTWRHLLRLSFLIGLFWLYFMVWTTTTFTLINDNCRGICYVSVFLERHPRVQYHLH